MLDTKCEVSWCNKKALAMNLCKKHYRRRRRTGQAVQLNHPDVIGVLEAGLKVLAHAELLTQRAHKANGHKSSFELCQSASCQDYHKLALLFTSKEEVSHGTENSQNSATKTT